jgi:hypothetical protein
MMPSSSAKQHRFMEAIAHNKAFAKKVGVPQSVGQEFAKADKGKTFKKGGDMKESKKMIEKEVSFMKKKGAPASMIKHEKAEMEEMKRGGKVKKMAAGGMSAPADPRMAARRRPAIPGGMRSNMAPPAMPMPPAPPAPPAGPAPTMGMKKGGMAMPKTMAGDVEKGSNKKLKFGESAVQKSGHTKGKNLGDSGKSIGIEGGAKRFASGGYVSSADGIAQRGKTRFSMPKMKGKVI